LSAVSPDPRYSLRPTTQLRRRKLVNFVMEALGALAAFAGLAVLGLVIWAVAKRGIGAINRDFFTEVPATFGETGGGIANSIAGSIVIVLVATLFALPVGVLIGIYLNELAPQRLRRYVSLVLDVLNGLPSIVIGIFVYGLLVIGSGQAAWKASFALAVIMLPLVARSTQEVLRLVPDSLREASTALGVAHWRTTLGVVLPTSLGGIFTGATLAIARAAGETAPLLFTCSVTISQVSWKPSEALQSIPLTIFQFLESPDPADHEKAWAASLVLMTFVLVLSVLSKLALAHSRRKLNR
jgi:phosphate transport system permease protein